MVLFEPQVKRLSSGPPVCTDYLALTEVCATETAVEKPASGTGAGSLTVTSIDEVTGISARRSSTTSLLPLASRSAASLVEAVGIAQPSPIRYCLSLLRERPSPAAGHRPHPPRESFRERLVNIRILAHRRRTEGVGPVSIRKNQGSLTVRNRSIAFRSLIPLAAPALAAVLTISGCSRDASAEHVAAPPPAPQVTVARVIARTVTDSETFSGRFASVNHVDIRPRVTGYISSVNFVDGTVVHKGQVLFVIDPRPYEADYQHAQADLEQARAQAALARAERIRAVNLFAAHAISKDEFDTRTANERQSAANVEAAKAAVAASALNLTFTRVTAPITGRVSRAIVTTGNLVTNGQTLLTTVVSLDPIYVEFNADEQAYLAFEKYAGNGWRKDAPAIGSAGPDALGNAVYVGLADENGYPHAGHLVFMDNSLDAQTGTIYARALLANSDGHFVPGLFARVKLIGNDHYPAVLINDSAIGTDQTMRYVLVLGSDNKVEYRPVELGPLVDGLRVVRSGLKPGDTIVVNGLMRVRPGMQVNPQLIAMGERHTDGTMVAQNATNDRGAAAGGSTSRVNR